jgi:hypothetical protein
LSIIINIIDVPNFDATLIYIKRRLLIDFFGKKIRNKRITIPQINNCWENGLKHTDPTTEPWVKVVIDFKDRGIPWSWIKSLLTDLFFFLKKRKRKEISLFRSCLYWEINKDIYPDFIVDRGASFVDLGFEMEGSAVGRLLFHQVDVWMCYFLGAILHLDRDCWGKELQQDEEKGNRGGKEKWMVVVNSIRLSEFVFRYPGRN